MSVAVNLDDCGINHGIFHVGIIRDSLEDPPENIGFDPITVTFEDSVPFAKLGWQIAPRTACSRNPKHGGLRRRVGGDLRALCGD